MNDAVDYKRLWLIQRPPPASSLSLIVVQRVSIGWMWFICKYRKQQEREEGRRIEFCISSYFAAYAKKS